VADAQGLPELARRRAAAQLLSDTKRRTAAAVVRHLLAVQAQDFASFPLALRARARGLELADVHGAIDSGELVVSWLNRGTLHLVHRDDFAWLHALTAPTTRTANKRRLAQEGVTDPARGVRTITKMLEDGPLLRREIGERIGFTGAALTHLLLAATLDGRIVRGPTRGKEQTFVLAPPLPKVDRDSALKELGIRYAAGHWPATRADLAYWSGLPLRDVPHLQGLTDRHPGDIPPRLLPAFDPLIMGWKERSFVIPSELKARVMPGGGMFRAVVLVDGRVAGTWSRAGGRVALDGDVARSADAAGFDGEIADVERFLG
jgi:hypothetical protein